MKFRTLTGILILAFPSFPAGATSFTVNGSTLVATDSGNVGIGTSSPGNTLDVKGTIGVSTINANGSTIANAALYGVYVASNVYINGGLGIGYSSIGGVSLATNNPIFESQTANNAYLMNSAGSFDGTMGNYDAHTWYLGYAAGPSGTGTKDLVWNDSGNVGIGTTNPASSLDISGIVTVTTLTAHNGVTVDNANQYGINVATNIFVNGGVGIGYTSIGGVSLGTNNPIFEAQTANNAYLMNSAGAYDGTIGNYDAHTWFLGYSGTVGGTGVKDLVWTDGGNVGIGTTNPTQALHVVGTIRQTTVTSCTLGLTTDASGDINGCSTSDQRLKTRIRAFSDSGKIIDGLVPHYYYWKDSKTKDVREHVGFVAQEVGAVFPQAVSQAGTEIIPSTYTYVVMGRDGRKHTLKGPDVAGDALYGVDPNALIAALVKEVQLLRQRVAALEAAQTK